MKKKLAPIILFVYNRITHTKKTIEYLQKNELSKESDLIIFSDGFKNDSDMVLVNNLRDYLKTIDGFNSVSINYRNENFGLASSIIQGVTDVLKSNDRAIILEDDLVTSKYFLNFMNDALEKYESREDVGSVHGYWYPIDDDLPDTFFIRGASCWGWGVWSSSWNNFEADGSVLLKKLLEKNLKNHFNLDNSMDYIKMLKSQISGKNDSWAIRWHASNFIKNKLQLHSSKSLVNNIGFDGTGTHCDNTEEFLTLLHDEVIDIKDIEIIESKKAREALIKYYKLNKKSLFKRAFKKVMTILKV